MKLFLSLLLLLASTITSAKVTLVEIQSAISCNSKISSNYWIRSLTSTYGSPSYREGGTLWFKASGSMYGSEITYVFVSVTGYHNFVGVMFKDPPTKLLDAVRTSRAYPTNLFPSKGHWVGSDGRSLMWHGGKYAKMFCSGMGNLPNRGEW